MLKFIILAIGSTLILGVNILIGGGVSDFAPSEFFDSTVSRSFDDVRQSVKESCGGLDTNAVSQSGFSVEDAVDNAILEKVKEISKLDKDLYSTENIEMIKQFEGENLMVNISMQEDLVKYNSKEVDKDLKRVSTLVKGLDKGIEISEYDIYSGRVNGLVYERPFAPESLKSEIVEAIIDAKESLEMRDDFINAYYLTVNSALKTNAEALRASGFEHANVIAETDVLLGDINAILGEYQEGCDIVKADRFSRDAFEKHFESNSVEPQASSSGAV